MLLGKYLMSTVWLYAKDPAATARFYRRQLRLPELDSSDAPHAFHFDAGGIRLSIHPQRNNRPPSGNDGFLVFLIEHGIGKIYAVLRRRKMRFRGGITSESFGRIAEFRDPDDRQLFLWEPPTQGSKEFSGVAKLVQHYERVRDRLQRSLYS